MCTLGCVVREVFVSMVYILSQAMFPIFNQGHQVDNKHPGASPQSTQPQEQSWEQKESSGLTAQRQSGSCQCLGRCYAQVWFILVP